MSVRACPSHQQIRGPRPGVVLPRGDLSPASQQFYRPAAGNNTTEGVAALMRAVLEDALGCFQKQFVKAGRRTRRLAKEAEEWFFTDDLRWPFSFVNICAALGLDPEAIRLGLKRWPQRHIVESRMKIPRARSTHRSLRIAA